MGGPNNDEVEEWGDCLPDCPTQITNPVCLMDPVPPALQDGYQGSKNYTTDFDFGVGTVTKGVLLGYSSTFLLGNNILIFIHFDT